MTGVAQSSGILLVMEYGLSSLKNSGSIVRRPVIRISEK